MSQGASEWPVDVNGRQFFGQVFFSLFASAYVPYVRACVRDSVPW